MKAIRLLFFMGIFSVTTAATAAEQRFFGEVDTINDSSRFGDGIEIGDQIGMTLTLDTVGPSNMLDLFGFLNGISGQITSHTWPSFMGYGQAGNIQVEVGEESFDCNIWDFASVLIGNDFQSASVETLLEPTDLFIANATDGVTELGSPPADCVDLRFSIVLASQTTDPLDDTSLQVPEDCSAWDTRRWTIDTPVFDTATMILSWNTIIAGSIETIGLTPEALLQNLIQGANGADLPAGFKNALVSSLENALAKIQSGNLNAAEGMLNAAINKIEAQSGKKVDPADAANGIAEIQAIIALLQNSC